MRMSTRACTRAYATSRLYSTLVLYRKVSNPSRPAFIMITVPVESDRHNVSCGKHHDYKAVSARHACETATVCQVAHLLNNETAMLSYVTLHCAHRTNPTASTVHQVHNVCTQRLQMLRPQCRRHSCKWTVLSSGSSIGSHHTHCYRCFKLAGLLQQYLCS